MTIRAIFLIALSLLASSAFSAEPQTKRITGIYSSLSYNVEGGDLLGMELLIIPSADGYSVFVQIAEGGAPFSVVVPLKVAGTKIEFTLPPGGTYSNEHFVGTFKSGELVVRWSQGAEEHLKHGKSYWQ